MVSEGFSRGQKRARETGCDCQSLEEQDLVWSNSDCVCKTCARVVMDHLFDESPEWYDNDHARADPVDQKYAKYLGDTSLAPIKKKYQEYDPNKNIRLGLQNVEQCAILIGLQSSHQMCSFAKQIYTDYATSRKESGRSIRESERHVAATCAIYFGCKSSERENQRNPRTIREVASWCQTNVQECIDMMKNYKEILHDKPYSTNLFHSVKANDLFVRATASLPIQTKEERQKVLNACTNINDIVVQNNIMEGRTPETICSAILYEACRKTGTKVTKKVIFKACGVTNVTLNKALNELYDKENLLNNVYM
jgi:transcription initiation factor TFIIIB Brf1 subunit/transcription initiation factor TFIIB